VVFFIYYVIYFYDGKAEFSSHHSPSLSHDSPELIQICLLSNLKIVVFNLKNIFLYKNVKVLTIICDQMISIIRIYLKYEHIYSYYSFLCSTAPQSIFLGMVTEQDIYTFVPLLDLHRFTSVSVHLHLK